MKPLPSNLSVEAQDIAEEFGGKGWTDIRIGLHDDHSNSREPSIFVYATDPKGIRKHWIVMQDHFPMATIRSKFLEGE